MPGFDVFAPGAATALVLLSVRLSGLLLVAPMFAARTIPVMVKAGVLVVLVTLMAPAAVGAAEGVPLTAATVAGEFVIGFAIGLGVAVMVGAAEMAGDLMAVQMGLAGSASLDPLTQNTVPVLGQLMHLFAVTLLLVAGAHLVMLEALAESARAVPLGAAVEVRDGVRAMIGLGTDLFALGLRFAAPLVAAVMVANIAVALLGRVTPQIQVLMVVFPVQIALGLAVVTVIIPLIGAYFGAWDAPFASTLDRVFGALAPVR